MLSDMRSPESVISTLEGQNYICSEGLGVCLFLALIQKRPLFLEGEAGVGKTEISRRLSKLAEAPFIKVEATGFTEVGYVGRDVEQIIRDLIEIAIAMERDKKRKEVHAKAQLLAEDKVLDALVGNKASGAKRESFRKRLRNGDLDNNQIEIEVLDTNSSMPSFEIPGMPGANVGMVNIGEILGKSMGNKKGKKKKMTVKEWIDIYETAIKK